MGRHPPSNKPPPRYPRTAELVKSIAPDVLRFLRQGGFFERLDDVLCPADPLTPRTLCAGGYEETERILRDAGFTEEDLMDVFSVMQASGGACDCEILHNVVEESRMKAGHWKAKAAGQR